MKRPIEKKKEVIIALLQNEVDRKTAANILSCSLRTVRRYKKDYLTKGDAGLKDKRHSNYYKVTLTVKKQLEDLKKKDRWRSARNIRDKLKLNVHKRTVERLFKTAGLSRENKIQVKALQTFEYLNPNDLWQTDIMGKIKFPNIGILYLIATLDDHSRFVPAGRWFKTQGKMNVFQIWYESLSKCGLPGSMLQDEGSQYKARTRFGTADYEWYANQAGIKLIWARSAECKGKIERFWKFVQKDFVPRVRKARSIEEVDGAFRVWLAFYNYKFKSRYFGGGTHWSKYKPSQKRLTKVELQTLLVVEERRKVTRESTISLYVKHYFVP